MYKKHSVNFLGLICLLSSFQAFAQSDLSIETKEVRDFVNGRRPRTIRERSNQPEKEETRPRRNSTSNDSNSNFDDKLEKTGKVISILRDIVATGEEIYKLLERGKPVVTTSYAPINILPRDSLTRDIVDIMDTEEWTYPIEKKYLSVIKKGSSEVVRFEFLVTFSHSGSYQGKGKWISGAQIIPHSVKTSWGWNVDASMSLNGIMNHGKVDDPIAGATLVIKYKLSSLRMAIEKNEVIHITGKGEIKNYTR